MVYDLGFIIPSGGIEPATPASHVSRATAGFEPGSGNIDTTVVTNGPQRRRGGVSMKHIVWGKGPKFYKLGQSMDK